MLSSLARSLFGSSNDRAVSRLRKPVAAINALEAKISALSDDDLKAQTAKFRARLEKGETLDSLLPEAFATVRETAKRVLGQRPFDVQLMGGIALHQGNIAEMRTGEGKTLVATLPTYLNAIQGKGVHVVTVNDYLAKRDSSWMAQIYGFLGLTTSCVVHGLDDDERRAAYAADITYGTNNEFGFDYLRDNMKFSLEEMVQRPFNFAIVDEVDSILIDEARTPLIISGPAEDSSELYAAVDKFIPLLAEGDFDKDEKQRTVALTESGHDRAERWLGEAGLLQPGGLYDAANVNVVHHLNQALRAHTLFTRDVDYIVKDNKVMIIDEFTGRMMEGRRYSEGLHQALEAKEQVEIQRENQTLASITFQNYFRLYPKLAGMTGTAMTEAAEFAEIYGLDVIDIPTNRNVARQDMDDSVFRSVDEKFDAIAKLIEDCRSREQPVLVGTVSIEKSERLSALLKKKKIPHNVLNARYHEQEAVIIAQAGRPGAVTIATNMAGRGTDIQLGGNLALRIADEVAEDAPDRDAKIDAIKAEVAAAKEKALAAGGLFVIGTERHESRRIDNQLRGRSGRQGDPGASKFFLSLEDDLLRIFGSDKMDGVLARLGLRDGEAITHPWISRSLEKAQQKVEARNFDIRKNLLKYDNVMNDQRKVIYEQRKEIMAATDVSDTIVDMREEVLVDAVRKAMPENSYPEQWDVETLADVLNAKYDLFLPIADWAKEDHITEKEIEDRVQLAAKDAMATRLAAVPAEALRSLEKAVLLQLLDQSWKDHLLHLDHLRQGINLRAYAQKDPFNEYGREAFGLFQDMLDNLRVSVTSILMKSALRLPSPEEILAKRRAEEMTLLHGQMDESTLPEGMTLRAEDAPKAAPLFVVFDANDPATWVHTPRNAPCPCGSGKKYKHCHGQAV
jgi:preprotein translocase subunit SecA